MLSTMKNFSSEQYEKKSKQVIQRLLSSKFYKQSHTIGVTISRFPEVDTRQFIEQAWKDGKRIAAPKCIPATREMDFRFITSWADVTSDYMDLLEPTVSRTKQAIKDDIDLQIVPGVLFSDEGFRVGFGGGYYDRYLAHFTGDTVAIAFKEQTGHELPVEQHDLPIGAILTDEDIIICRSDVK